MNIFMHYGVMSSRGTLKFLNTTVNLVDESGEGDSFNVNGSKVSKLGTSTEEMSEKVSVMHRSLLSVLGSLKIPPLCSDAFSETGGIPSHCICPFIAGHLADCCIHCCHHVVHILVAMTTDHLLQFCKDPVITRWQVRAIGRVWHLLNSMSLQEPLGEVWPMCRCIVMQQSPVPPELWSTPSHCFLELCQDLGVKSGIDTMPLRHPVLENQTLIIKKQDEHALGCWHLLPRLLGSLFTWS